MLARGHKRKAVSELVGTMLLLGMTLIAGFALFAYVQSQAGRSEIAYAQNVDGSMSYLQERFVIPQVTYTTSSVTVYVYTNGQMATQLAEVEVYGPNRTALDVVYSATTVTVNQPSSCAGQSPASSTNESPMLGTGAGSLSVNVNAVAQVKLTLPTCSGLSFKPGTLYFVDLLGQFGNSVTYYEKM